MIFCHNEASDRATFITDYTKVYKVDNNGKKKPCSIRDVKVGDKVSMILFISFLSLSPILKASPSPKISLEEALILLLYPEVKKQVDQYYKEYISDGPTLGPYSINIVDLYHTSNEYGAYHYTIILEARPYVGAHIDVGLDRITVSLSLKGIDSVLFEHCESKLLPPWLQHHVIKPLP